MILYYVVFKFYSYSFLYQVDIRKVSPAIYDDWIQLYNMTNRNFSHLKFMPNETEQLRSFISNLNSELGFEINDYTHEFDFDYIREEVLS